eukprot:2457237-Pyramimonas_sp.AAC.1
MVRGADDAWLTEGKSKRSSASSSASERVVATFGPLPDGGEATASMSRRLSMVAGFPGSPSCPSRALRGPLAPYSRAARVSSLDQTTSLSITLDKTTPTNGSLAPFAHRRSSGNKSFRDVRYLRGVFGELTTVG